LAFGCERKEQKPSRKFTYKLVLHKYDYIEGFEKPHKDNISAYNKEDGMD